MDNNFDWLHIKTPSNNNLIQITNNKIIEQKAAFSYKNLLTSSLTLLLVEVNS